MNTSLYRMGIDVGSTTAKVVILDRADEIMFSAYRRHDAETLATLQSSFQEVMQSFGDLKADLLVTGSAGLGISEKFNLPFIQEVVASAEVVRRLYPEVKTLIDIGGEDAKMIFFSAEGAPDIRMNGSCAGGTGAFIDQMATLLNIPVSELNTLAESHATIYPMASRCGVFAKTDVQNLLSREIARADIAASIFNAVVLQTLATLARGHRPMPRVLFSGGPLTFLPALKVSFMKVLNLDRGDVLEVNHAELLPAIGAAMADTENRQTFQLTQLMSLLSVVAGFDYADKDRLPALFTDRSEFQRWQASRVQCKIEKVDVGQVDGKRCFLGVDSGSTTTKLVLVDTQGRIVFDHYASNNGNPIEAVRKGLERIQRLFADQDNPPRIARSVVTGYGEDLIRAAFGFDEGMVETLAHFRAARAFDPDVSFILDIGGQDMKAIFVRDGRVRNIVINEACSSGCGSFIESFAQSTGYSVAAFARKACLAEAPCDLGTRCTVFMNSKVKQALREGAGIDDISAGLAYSVIKNALHKVLRITDTAVLGEHIVVQGGTFRNPAIHKAMERLVGREVLCPDIAELMGAYGAALTARDADRGSERTEGYTLTPAALEAIGDYEKRTIRCRGCENRCTVTKLVFQNNNVFYTGNRCERIFTNSGEQTGKGANLLEFKYHLLFDRETRPVSEPRLTLGIPRALNLFENFPFWSTLFVESGIEIRLSDPSSNPLYEKGAGSIMSENICFPAKLTHGHILNLIEAGVDRIFYPMVVYERQEFTDSINSYNCPIVAGYPDVIRSAIDPAGQFGVPFDTPAVTFQNVRLLERVCARYLKGLGVDRKTCTRAFSRAVEAQAVYKETLRAKAAELLSKARAEGRTVILLIGRPYQLDPLINHKVADMLADFGVDVITEDAVPQEPDQKLGNPHVLTQWAYSNRFYHAARWAGQQENVEVVQLNSFGCGPDAVSVDEVKSILAEHGKGQTVIRIDEIVSTGSMKLRLRSMIEALNHDGRRSKRAPRPRKTTQVYQAADRRKVILAPQFSHFYAAPLVRPLLDLGFQVETLPPADRESVEIGLKYTNNDICYPAIIVIGDLIKALQSGRYDPSDVAVGITQTGGQCRATSYLSLLKRALLAAGFARTPVVSLTTSLRALNEQPGFKFDVKRYAYKAMMSIVYADSLSAMYHATAVRERIKGQALALANRYMALLENGALPLDKWEVLSTLEQAVVDFNALPVNNCCYPKVGIVGEIYDKYNAFANNEVVHWLMGQGIEVVGSSLIEFFASWSVSANACIRSGVKQPDLRWLLLLVAQKYIQSFLNDAESIMRGFRREQTSHTIQDVARRAQEIVALTHQYGEGWLIAGEIGAFVEDGIQSVLCLQPFGCIANHVIAKGVGRRLKEKHPGLNLLFLDTDSGTSEVNFFNRLYFFVNHAKTRG